MKCKFVLAGVVTVAIATGCAGPNTTARNIETAASINSLAGVPGAGWVGLAASAADIILKSGKPKFGTTSKQLSTYIDKTPGIVWEMNGQYRWGEYAIWRENGETVRVRRDQIPQEKLDYKAAWAKAVGLVQQGIFSEDNIELQKTNLDAWEKGEVVAAEYYGLNGKKVIAVSKNREAFEIMLPEEWTIISKAGK